MSLENLMPPMPAPVPTEACDMVVGVVSDTHGYLDPSLIDALDGVDAIVHAGDICSRSDYERLCRIAPVRACLGNNDYSYAYGPEVPQLNHFRMAGLRWQVCHYRERLEPRAADVAICGHTHRPFAETAPSGCLVMNPGSPTFPRTTLGPTCGRIAIAGGVVQSAEIIQLEPDGI